MAGTLADLVGDTAAFGELLALRRPEVFRPAAWPAGVSGPAELDEALRGGLLRVPYVEMVRAGKVVPEAEFCTARTVAGRREQGFADPERIERLLADGATLLLPQLDQWHPSVRALAADIALALGRRTEAFVFATGTGRRGLDVHRDDADVLVVQLAGEKEWTVHEAPTDGRWHPGPAPQPGPVALATVLRAGQVLYVPRGAAHAATGHAGLSVHLSFTVREAGTGGLRGAIGEWLAGGDWAETLPQRPATEGELLATAAELLRLGRARLDELTPERLLRLARGPLPAPEADDGGHGQAGGPLGRG
ncbi:JmjC domain-containing protein [Kitasatospora sp. NPDC004531]